MTDKNFKSLFLAHRQELLAHLTKALRDGEIAVDLTQETFLRFAEQGGSSIGNSRSNLYRTVHNLVIDHIRVVDSR